MSLSPTEVNSMSRQSVDSFSCLWPVNDRSIAQPIIDSEMNTALFQCDVSIIFQMIASVARFLCKGWTSHKVNVQTWAIYVPLLVTIKMATMCSRNRTWMFYWLFLGICQCTECCHCRRYGLTWLSYWRSLSSIEHGKILSYKTSNFLKLRHTFSIVLSLLIVLLSNVIHLYCAEGSINYRFIQPCFYFKLILFSLDLFIFHTLLQLSQSTRWRIQDTIPLDEIPLVTVWYRHTEHC